MLFHLNGLHAIGGVKYSGTGKRRSISIATTWIKTGKKNTTPKPATHSPLINKN